MRSGTAGAPAGIVGRPDAMDAEISADVPPGNGRAPWSASKRATQKLN